MKNYKPFFIKALKANFPNDFQQRLSEVENHYQIIAQDSSFAATSTNPIDRRLDFSAYFLALIKMLDARGERFERIRTICLEVVLDYVKPKNKFQSWLKKLPVKLMNTWLGRYLIRALQKKAGQLGHPDGFLAHIITDKAETYGFGYGIDIIECGICKLFNKHHSQKYASILCEVDEVTSNLAGLQLIRGGTIANGAKKCDFRYKRMVILLGYLLLTFWACSNSTPGPREGVILSPEKSKSLEFIPTISNDVSTQVMLNFEKGFVKGGSGVFAVRADKHELMAKWVDEEHIVIEYPAKREISQQWDSIQHFKNRVYVRYEPYDSCLITAVRTAGIMDTVTVLARIELSGSVEGQSIALINEQQKIIAVTANTEGKWRSGHIPLGHYRIMVEDKRGKCYSAALKFTSGEIKEIKVLKK